MSSNDMLALAACPFCGRAPVLLEVTESDKFVRCYEVRCDECAIEVSEEYKHEAIERWNTRAVDRSGASREEIARLINRHVYDAGVFSSEKWDDVNEFDKKSLLDCADAIISLRPVGRDEGESVQGRFAESESTTHRKSYTEWTANAANMAWIKRLFELVENMHLSMSTGGDFKIPVTSEVASDIMIAASYIAAQLKVKVVSVGGAIEVHADPLTPDASAGAGVPVVPVLVPDPNSASGQRVEWQAAVDKAILPHAVAMPPYHYQTQDIGTGSLYAVDKAKETPTSFAAGAEANDLPRDPERFAKLSPDKLAVLPENFSAPLSIKSSYELPMEASTTAQPIQAEGVREAAIRECIEAARNAGNFGDYKREELTHYYGLPRFDMMTSIIEALAALSPPAKAEAKS